MKYLLIFLLFFAQPVFWVGLIRSVLNHTSRLKRTRAEFVTSVDPRNFELRSFFWNEIVLGLIFSFLSWLLEVTLPLSWFLTYEGLTLITLIFIPRFVMPIILASATSIIMLFLSILRINPDLQLVPFSNYLLITGLVVIASGLYIWLNGGRFNIPKMFHNQRGNLIAGYPFKNLAVVPFLAMFPATPIEQYLPFYPQFDLGGHTVCFVLVPILLGIKLTVFKNLPKLIYHRIGLRLMIIGLVETLMFLLFVTSFEINLFILVLFAVLAIMTLELAHHYDLHHGEWYSKPLNGVRVVGIVPKTPASKMRLKIGDIILQVNGHAIKNEDEFYKALQAQPTFCKLKVLNREHRLVLRNTAIYNNAPREIGVILFQDEHY